MYLWNSIITFRFKWFHFTTTSNPVVDDDLPTSVSSLWFFSCNKQEEWTQIAIKLLVEVFCFKLSQHRCVLCPKYVIFYSNMIISLSEGKNRNMICRLVKVEFWLFEGRLREVGLQLTVKLSGLQSLKASLLMTASVLGIVNTCWGQWELAKQTLHHVWWFRKVKRDYM